MGYSLEQFLMDCKTLGWYEGKAGPIWMSVIDIEPDEEDLEKVLMYQEDKNDIPIIMDYWKKDSEEGVHFGLNYMSRGMGSGSVTSKEDLCTYMKVAGYNNGFVPKPKKVSHKPKKN